MFDNFTFFGRHVTEYGYNYAESASRILRGRVARNEYTIGGESGTALYEGERYEPFTRSGVLYPARDHTSVADNPDMVHALLAWLTQGRGELIYDRAPSVYRLAQCDEAVEHTWEGWPLGAIRVTMTLQPFAYSVRETYANGSIAADGEILLALDTDVPAPLRVAITPDDGATITGATISAEGRRIELQGLDVRTGKQLVVDCERPIRAAVDGTSVMSCVTFFERLRLSGPGAVGVELTYGAGGGARVQVAARGRFV